MLSVVKSFLVIGALGIATPIVAQDYECSGEGDVSPGVCLPKIGEIVGDQPTRAALYVRCRTSETGTDEYHPSCCDHLTEYDERIMQVCSGRSIPAKGLQDIINKGEIGSNYAELCEQINCAGFEDYLGE